MQLSKTNNSGVYRLRNTRNGKMYIGSANDFKRRSKEHLHELKNNRHANDYLQNAYNKEPKVFVFEKLLLCNRNHEMLIMYEQQFLDFYKNSSLLYNRSMIAGRAEMTPETRAKLSAAKKGKPSQSPGHTGRKHTSEAIAKISAAKKGKPGHRKGVLHTAETKAKISAAKKGKPGYKKSAEHRAKLSAVMKAKRISQGTA